MSGRDELDEIFVDKNEPANKRLIVEILKPYVTIDKEGVISFSDNYDKLKENQKVLIYLLCKKAMVLKEIEGVTEPARPTEISKQISITEGNAKHAIFRDYKKVLKKEGNGYIVPNYNLKKIKGCLVNNGTE